MATAKQIAANRANAQHSTGPKTALGKRKSSRNAYRHGLSWPLPCDSATASRVEAIARALMPLDLSEEELSWASDLARAQVELLRIREIRSLILMELDLDRVNTVKLRQLLSLDRYERYAHTKRRQAAANF
jgi:hypothetical protein